VSKTNGHIVTPFDCLAWGSIAPLQNSKGNLVRALNTRMWENFCNYRFLSRKRYEIVNHQQKVIDSQSIGVGSNDLKWPWKVSNEGHNFLAGLHNYARAVWPKMTEFGMITHTGGEKHICKGVSHLPIPRWRAPTFTKFLRPLPTPKRFVLERPNLVRQHMRSRSVFLGGQPRTPPRERASPIFLWIVAYHMLALSMRNNNEILHWWSN